MIFNTRSGNFYRYDRYTHQIEPIAASAISKGGRVDVCEEKLQALSFEPIPNITTLPNISTFIIEITRQCNLRCSYCLYSGKYPRNRGVDGIEPFKTINDAEDFIRLFERNEKNAQSYMLGVEHQENGLIGMIGYDYIDEDEKTANLFFVLDKGFWHKGIMTVVMRSLFNYHSSECRKVFSICNLIINCDKTNNRALSLIKRFIHE